MLILSVYFFAEQNYLKTFVHAQEPTSFPQTPLSFPKALDSQRVYTYSEPVYGFYLEGNVIGELSKISVELKLANGTTKTVNDFNISEIDSDSQLIANTFYGTTQLKTFPEKISQITLIYAGSEDIEVRTVSNSIGNNQVKTAALSDRAQREKTMFQNMGLNIVTREEWGGPETTNWYPEYQGYVNQIVVHHTATNIDNNDPANAVRAIYNFHYFRCNDGGGSWNPSDPNAREGCNELAEVWEDIGYNYLIDQNGTIYEGRWGGNGVQGAHSWPNDNTIGIAVIGNYSNSMPSNASLESLSNLIGKLAKLNNLNIESGTSLVGHRHRNYDTACPGDPMLNYLPTLAQRANQYKDSFETLNNAIKKASDLLVNRSNDFINPRDGYVQVLIRDNTLDSSTRMFLLNNTPTVESISSSRGRTVFSISENFLRKFLSEVITLAPSAVVQPNFIYKTSSWDNTSPTRSIPSDYNSSTHWNLEKTRTPEAWKELGGCVSDSLCGGNPAVTVAVLDTGVAYENFNYDAGGTYTLGEFNGLNIEVPTSSANATYNEGYDRQYQQVPELSNTHFTASSYDASQDFLCMMRDGSANPCNAQELLKIDHANDDQGHGTFVAGIISANTSDSAPNQVVGIAHNVTIMPVKVFFPNDSSMCYDGLGNNDPSCLPQNAPFSLRSVGSTVMIAWGIDYAVANGADVINMSLSGSGSDPLVQDSIDAAVAQGVVVVVAAGNNNANVANYFPGNMNNVITVGAVNADNTRSNYSNFGSQIDLVAPVGQSSPGVVSQSYSCSVTDSCFDETNPNLFTAFGSSVTPAQRFGTSFATPQVSAAAALLKSKNINTAPSDVEKIIKYSSQDIGDVGKDSATGYGLLDLEYMLKSTWGSWLVSTQTTNKQITSVSFEGNLFQAVKSLEDRILIRSFDGNTWSSWTGIGGSTPNRIGLAEDALNNRLYLSVRGKNSKIYTRYYSGGVWSDWIENGGSAINEVAIKVLSGVLIQSVVGDNLKIYTRTFDGATWSEWIENGSTSGSISMQVFNGSIYQSARGLNSKIYTRSFNGSWSNWTENGGSTASDVILASDNTNLYQAVLGSNSKIYTRYFNGSSWSTWMENGGSASSDIAMSANNNQLFQSVIGSDSKIYTRLFENNTWKPWVEVNGTALGFVDLFFYNNNLHQTVTGTNQQIYTRILSF